MKNHHEVLLRDVQGFAPPCCPDCAIKGTLDQLGYYCEQCSAEIPNGSEFDDAIAALAASKAKPTPVHPAPMSAIVAS